MVKNLPTNAGDARDAASIPGSGRSPGEGHGNPLPYSCLENPMDGYILNDFFVMSSFCMKNDTPLTPYLE